MERDGKPLNEELVLPSLGTYLKLPSKFKQRFGLKGKRVPDPQAYYRLKDGEVRLIYKWSAEQLDNANDLDIDEVDEDDDDGR